MSQLSGLLRKQVQLSASQTEIWGQNLHPLGNFSEKPAILTFLESFENTKLLKSASQPTSLLTGEVQNTFKRLYFGLHFIGSLAKERGLKTP